ncbi:hypothetical protein [Nocardioides sp.]|uniref:hypothetical protein n=1 Tax=Nocardioides sp. TaxID=35761 RepID=UPI002B26D882|nr:hypothetical protein [Nocardioides sp.]
MSYDKIEHADNPVVTDDQTSADDEVAAIEVERRRRLDPDNRSAGTEVDNTHATLPTLEAWEAEHGTDADESVGTSDPSKTFAEMEVSEEEKAEIAAERERRLDPANRPAGAEVDNTGRTVVDGRFVD